MIDSWVYNKVNSRLKGRHTKSFINNIHQCITILKDLMPEELVSSLCGSLCALYIIRKILSMVVINDYNMVKHVLPSYTTIKICQVWTKYPKKSYQYMIDRLTISEKMEQILDKTTAWRSKTFNVHVLTKYMSHILNVLYERHKLGTRIFSMEGFEYKNHTSKHILDNRTNGKLKTNVFLQSICVMNLFYHYGYHEPSVEVKQRGKRK